MFWLVASTQLNPTSRNFDLSHQFREVDNNPILHKVVDSLDMDPAPLPPKKRSLFTAKAQAKRKKVTEEDALNFSRAKELEAERYAEEERQRQRRIAKSERTAQITERKRSTQSAEDHQSTATPPKKRKVSVKGDEKDGNASDSSAPAEPEEPTWERG